ncbi:dehydrogenase/reductase SDR family member on chromosome X-like [Linepithema humile]|uniref:dehydrogenase/reductase SDR family member on chromosome X-like n=1 Tax=Linepithema humile TaxID=83485 RepID=UPI000623A47D|nr:PREDICTED: dehydrogenase/reductase SDR family member on chromosome X-like [Linepithema humile]XP_012217295.1 PREDICTED: dehydrogenase/reductase SDR family member on chromosome X-like [Linepithema humile]
MLLEMAAVCIPFMLGSIAYFFPFNTCYAYGTIILQQIKLNYFGVRFWFHDVVNARYNKLDLPLMPEKTAIITGGSRGIGARIVKKLLQCDMNVILACRTVSAGEQLILQIRKSGVISGRPKVYKLDNSSLGSVREFAEQIKKDYSKIHILINNAGVMLVPTYKETEDGFEEQWAVNYLSHFLLTSLLLPLLKAGGRSGESSRIINVTSCVQYMGVINFDDINSCYKGTYFTITAYTQSKLAQVIFTVALQQFLKDRALNVETFSVHPGVVNTELFNHTYLRGSWVMSLAKTPDEGAIPILYAALNKDIENKGGIYISNCKEYPNAAWALQKNIQKQLFELSLKQVKLHDFFQYL